MAMLDLAWRARPDTLAASIDPLFKRYSHSRLLSRQFRDIMYGDDRHQIVTTQPQIGKTTICSKWGPVWCLDEQPDMPIMLLSSTIRLARRNARACRNVLRDNRAVLRTSLAPDQTAADHWNTPQGGGVLAAGVDGPIAGFSGGLVIIDDPHKNRREANSQIRRDSVWDWWTDDVMTRLQGEERVLIVMTRWHPDDLVGRLLEHEPGKWKVTALPAIAEPELTGIPDPLGRSSGEVVCPERFSLDQMVARRASTPAITWASMYQCRPTVAEGEILKRDWWVLEDEALPPHRFDLIITSWDLTFDDEGNAFTVGQLWGKTYDATRPHYHLLDQVRGHWDYPTQRRAILGFASKHARANLHLIEKAANGAAMIKELAPVLSGIIPIKPQGQGSKKDRAHSITPLLSDGQVHLPNWLSSGAMRDDGTFRESWVDLLIDECAEFRGIPGEVNDQVDALTQALNYMREPTAGEGKPASYDPVPSGPSRDR